MNEQQFRDGSVDLLLPSEAPANTNSVEFQERIARLQWARERGEEFHNIGFGRFSIPLVQAAARAHNITRMDAPRYANFYRAYSPQAFDELLALFRAENFAFLFTCFRVILAVKDKNQRAELTKRGVKERCGAEALRALMEETVGNSAPKHGRPPGMLKLSGEKLERTVERKKKKFAGHVEMVLAARQDLRPEFRCELQQMLNALQ